MMQKKLILTLILILLIQLGIAQQNYATLSVRVNSGIFLREEPNVESKAICSILFLQEVSLVEYIEKFDTIAGVIGQWAKVKFMPHEGYVFAPYLTHKFYRSNPQYPANFPQLMYEFDSKDDLNCASYIYFNPDLVWYGLYELEEEKSFGLVKVNIEYEILDCCSFKLKTDQDEKSMVLIGLPSPTFVRRFYDIVPKHVFYNNTQKHFYPGQSLDIARLQGKKYNLNAIGSVDENAFGYCTTITGYQLRISEISETLDQREPRENQNSGGIVVPRTSGQEQKEIWKNQNLLDDLDFLGECGRSEVIFIGDLDLDKIPDLILSSSSNSHSGYFLFLSTYSNQEKILEKVAIVEFENCY